MVNLDEVFYDLYTRLVEKIHEHRALRDDIADDVDTKSFENGAIYGVQEAINLLHIVQNESATNGDWININDGLPEEKSKCLVYGDSLFWVSGFELGRFDFNGHKITHWQYLPNKPKG